jgi:putative membrane protein
LDVRSHKKDEQTVGGELRDAEVREHLANERTLLAWVRTGVGLISIGFVIERAGVLAAASPVEGVSVGVSTAFGFSLAMLGCLTLVMGVFQFLRNRKRIITNTFTPDILAYVLVVVGSLALAGSFMVFVLLR